MLAGCQRRRNRSPGFWPTVVALTVLLTFLSASVAFAFDIENPIPTPLNKLLDLKKLKLDLFRDTSEYFAVGDVELGLQIPILGVNLNTDLNIGKFDKPKPPKPPGNGGGTQPPGDNQPPGNGTQPPGDGDNGGGTQPPTNNDDDYGSGGGEPAPSPDTNQPPVARPTQPVKAQPTYTG